MLQVTDYSLFFFSLSDRDWCCQRVSLSETHDSPTQLSVSVTFVVSLSCLAVRFVSLDCLFHLICISSDLFMRRIKAGPCPFTEFLVLS